MGRFTTSDLGLRQRSKAHVKSGSPHSELQLFLSHRHSSAKEGASTCVPVYVATYHARIPSGWSSSRVAWKQDPKTRPANLLSANSCLQLPAVSCWTSSLRKLSPLWEKPCHYWGHCTAQGNQEPTRRPSATKSISKAWTLRSTRWVDQMHVQLWLQLWLFLLNLTGQKFLSLRYCCTVFLFLKTRRQKSHFVFVFRSHTFLCSNTEHSYVGHTYSKHSISTRFLVR